MTYDNTKTVCPSCGSEDVHVREANHPKEDFEIIRCDECGNISVPGAEVHDNVEDLLPEVFYEGEDADPQSISEKDVSVELVSYPEWDQVERMLVDSSIAAFGYEPHKYDRLTDEERDKMLSEIMEGGALPNSLEGVKYVFYISDISKTFLAQLTRHRIGVSFTSVTSGNFDQRHTPFIVPYAVEKYGHKDTYEEAARHAYDAYAKMVDDGVPMETAREVLPQAIRNYNVMTVNFRALQTIFGIRAVEPQQPVVWKYVLKQMKEEISRVHPELAEHLEYHNSYEDYPMDLSWSNYNQFPHPEAPEDHPAGDEENFIYDKDAREMRE